MSITLLRNTDVKFCLLLTTLIIIKQSCGEFNFSEYGSCPTYCECSTYFYGYITNCSSANLRVNSYASNTISIRCANIHDEKLFRKLIPNMGLGKLNEVEIIDCPLAETLSIENVSSFLGLMNYTTLLYTNIGLSSINMKKSHLSGLHGLLDLKLEIYINTEKYLDPDLFSDESLRNLTKLEIFSATEELSADLFKHLKSLRYIKLYKKLQSLPFGIFRNQIHLEELYLNINEIKEIHGDIFPHGSPLYILDLSVNNIVQFEATVFESLTNLSVINISFNQYRLLPNDLFKNNKNLTAFKLLESVTKLPLKALPAGLLADQLHLTSVKLSCKLEVLQHDLFMSSTNIEEISIYENNLKVVSSEAFKTQYNLKKLILSKNNLTHLPMNLFQNTKRLKVLDLSENKLSNISSKMFQNLINLDELVLAQNELYVDSIKFDITMNKLVKLNKLSLKQNFISHIPTKWILPSSLEYLDLSDNYIGQLSGIDFKWISSFNIKFLSVDDCNIERIILDDINDTWFINTTINIYLEYNPIRCDCRLLSFVQFLRGEFKPHLSKSVFFETFDMKCKFPTKLNGKEVAKLNPTDLICRYDNDENNSKKCPEICDCWERTSENLLTVDCSDKNLTFVPDLSHIVLLNLKRFELNIENNQITKLPSFQTPGYSNLTSLLMAGNNLTTISREDLPTNLIVLDARRNEFSFLDYETLAFLNQSKLLQKLYFSKNPWRCDCDENSILDFIANNYNIFTDFSNMTCANTADRLKLFEFQEHCLQQGTWYRILIIIVFMSCLFLASLFVFYYKYRRAIRIWLYAHNMCLCWVSEYDLDKDKKYDAFISYSGKDEDFVLDCLVPELENGSPPFTLCVHERDWLIGECIPDQIIHSVNSSRRTVVILSNNFIESVWAKLEFNTAHQASLDESRNKVIVIMYGEIDNIDKLDSHLKSYISTNTYLKWGDPWFWKKLRYALPHISKNQQKLDNI